MKKILLMFLCSVIFSASGQLPTVKKFVDYEFSHKFNFKLHVGSTYYLPTSADTIFGTITVLSVVPLGLNQFSVTVHWDFPGADSAYIFLELYGDTVNFTDPYNPPFIVEGPSGTTIITVTTPPPCERYIRAGVLVFQSQAFNSPLLAYSSFVGANSCLTTGIEETKFSKFNLFPNPAKDILYIQVPGRQNDEILFCRLVDVEGKVIRDYQLGVGASESIDVSDLSRGVYAISLLKNHGAIVETKKLILQ